jgi:hypothetical protein
MGARRNRASEFGPRSGLGNRTTGRGADRDLLRLGGISACGGCLCLALAVTFVAVPALRLPSFVPAVTVVNPNDGELAIEISGADGGGWLELGSVPPHSTGRWQEVIDQGGQWVFRFRRVGDSRGFAQLQLSREELKAARWSITVPTRLLAPWEVPRSPELDYVEGP